MYQDRDVDRLRRRFEIAIGNFGRSCITMKANEKAFQAWYASSLIQEFGLSRVYRELHFWKPELFDLAGSNGFYDHLEEGNELFPDIAVSWQPDIDARHSSTRHEALKGAGNMLLEVGILSEFKVTGSTVRPTPFSKIKHDLAKLAIFTAAQDGAVAAKKQGRTSMACYMVILDNFDGDPEASRYIPKSFQPELEALEWPVGVQKPTLVVIRREDDHRVAVDTYRQFSKV